MDNVSLATRQNQTPTTLHHTTGYIIKGRRLLAIDDGSVSAHSLVQCIAGYETIVPFLKK